MFRGQGCIHLDKAVNAVGAFFVAYSSSLSVSIFYVALRHQKGRAEPSINLILDERGLGDNGEDMWVRFVQGEIPCRARLKLREPGVTDEAADIQVFCESCGKQKCMSEAFGAEGMKNLPACNGRYLHLRSYDKEQCLEQSRTISLGTSNSWFSLALSTLAVPNALDRLAQRDEWVMDAARFALDEYLKYSAYICQPHRSFLPCVRMAFYTRNVSIQ